MENYSMKTNSTHWTGIDVAKMSFDAAIVFHGQEISETPMHTIPVKTFTRTPEGVQAFLNWLDTQISRQSETILPVRAIMESTGVYSSELYSLLVDSRATLSPAIVNPHRTAHFMKSLGVRNKTDRLDARVLAFYGMERRPVPYTLLPPEWRELRELNRYRDFLVSEKVSMMNRGDDTSEVKLVRQASKRRMNQLEKDIKKVEQEMRAAIDKMPELKKIYTLLTSIPGVALLSACTIMAELGDLRRFKRSKQISAFAGLNPCLRDSGTSIHGYTHLSKSGNPRIRQALYMSALAAIRVPGPLKKTYDHHIASGKKAKSALGIVMRKLLVLMRAVLISNTPYDKDYQAGGKLCGKTAL